ncbi:5-hydroxytryptamine receptor-like [Lytechinus pictus]|uniref:5-hydroxytryptamine receptor-like n=1 Tax=Lytechinus pictus TaxID=7653 RepID=UPI0030BA000D
MADFNSVSSGTAEGIWYHNITLCNVTFFVEKGDFILQDYPTRVVLAFIVLLIFLIGTLGNLFVVAAVVLCRRLQNKTNVFVVNLAVADFLTAMFLPVHASTLLSKSSCYIPDLLCQFVAAATMTTLGCSIVTLAMVAFYRFTVLYTVLQPTPKFTNTFSSRNVALMVAFAWLYPIILMFIILPFDVGSLGYAIQYKVCAQNTASHDSDYLTLIVCLLVQIPAFVVIIVCYFYIFKMFSRHQREMNAMMAPSPYRQSSTLSNRESNITIIEDIPIEDPQVASNGNINIGFDDCDGTKAAPPDDLEVLAERFDAEELPEDNQDVMKNEEHSPKSLELSSVNRSKTTGSSTSSVQRRAKLNTVDTLAREQEIIRFRQQRQITINLFIVVCVYTICVMPSAIIFPIPSTGPAIPWLTILILLNSCVNPIIYALRHPTFSEVLKCMVRCRYREIPEPSSFLRSFSN